jgi:hypothetical protein
MKEPRREVIRAYNSLWKIPFKIYSVNRHRLIMPISPIDAMYFVFLVLIVFAIDRYLPFLDILFAYKFGIPALVLFALKKIKPDGKSLHRYFTELILYSVTNSEKEGFKKIDKKQQLEKFDIEIKFSYKGE